MSDHFLLELDTTAPELTFGTVAGAEAGQLLQVAYTVDEPEAISAKLVPASGPHVTLTVYPDRVEGYLDPGITGGVGEVRITTRDDVLNEAVWTLAVDITSVISAPPSTPARRGPGITPTGPGRSTTIRRRRSHVRIHATSSTRLSRDPVRSRSQIEARGGSYLQAKTRSTSGVAAAGSSSLQTHRKVKTEVSALAGTDVRRREGPDEEALLLELL